MAVVPPRVLSIAGTDPLCGAGGVADALVLARLGVHPLVVESALVEQDSCGVRSVYAVPIGVMLLQIDRALHDGQPAAVKIGLLPTAEHVRAVFAKLAALSIPVVLDPVLGSAGGVALVDHTEAVRDALLDALRAGLLVTPNARELGILAQDATPATLPGASELAQRLADTSGASVLAKGGHLEPLGADLLVHNGVLRRFGPLKWGVRDIHGTGCHLSSAIAAGLARGQSMEDAVAAARRALARWSRSAAVVGQGRPQFLHSRRG